MVDVWRIEAEDGPSAVGELIAREETTDLWSARVVRGERVTASAPDRRALCIPLDGVGASVNTGVKVPVARLAVASCEGECGFEAEGRLLVVDVDPSRCQASVEAIRLGNRRWRESYAAARDLLILTIGGAVTIRISDEEEPFAVEDGQSLWLSSPESGTEVDLVGASPDSVAVVVEIGPP